jgi:PST family polysaccharide transporter
VTAGTRTPDPERWFQIDAVRAGLRARSVRSGVIAMSARGTLIVLNIGAVMVLARILRPQDFGVLAMILPLTILFNGIANHALQTSIIHHEHLDHARASAIFRSAALRNLVLAALMAGAGPLLGLLYHDARATSVAIAWAAVLYLATLGAMHEALLKRQMRFGTVLSANLAGMLLGIAVAIAAAMLGAQHWALFLQFAAMDLFRSAAVWKLCNWRPSLRWLDAAGRAQKRTVLDYWRQLAAYRAVSWLGDHPDRILVGHLGGATALGLYDSARRWAFYPVTELFMSLSDVAVATFSRVAHDAARYRAFVSRALLPVLSLPLPVIAFVFVEAGNAVLIMLGDQWLAAVPFVQLMCIAAFVGSLGRITPWLFLSRGEAARQLRWSLGFQVPVLLGCVLIGARFGALGVARGFTIGTCLVALPSLAWALRGSPLRLTDVLRIAARPMVASLGAAGVMATINGWLPDAGRALPNLLVRLAVFGPVYVSLWLAWPGGRSAAREVLEALRELRARSARRAPAAPEAVVSAP